jgi:hypothetical protein
MNDLRHYDVIVSPAITEKATMASERNQVVFNVVNGRVSNEKGVFNGRQFAFFEFHVHYRTDNAGDSSDIHMLYILLIRAA